MTYILSNEEGSERSFSDVDWYHLYQLADRNSWDPAGTKLDPDTVRLSKGKREIDEEVLKEVDEWDGSYFPKSHQKVIVTKADAANWTTTLENVLKRGIIPNEPLSEHDKKLLDKAIKIKVGGVIIGDIDPVMWFAGRKEMLRDFIAVCRKGFSISYKSEEQA